MTSKERILAAWRGQPVDYVPLTTWSFGLPAHKDSAWEHDGVPRRFWYSLRMEHIHTLPQPWTLEDDFKRVSAWRNLGVDDILEVSVPWSMDPAVMIEDAREDAGVLDPTCPVSVRTYATPAGNLRHAVRQTGEDVGEGWVVQPDHVPLFEDYNIPRGIDHAVSGPAEIEPISCLFRPPDQAARAWFGERMRAVGEFAAGENVPVQAWAGFGMDAVVWLCGVEGAIMLALDVPEAFARLMEIVAGTDLARAELAAAHPGVDAVVARGWYSSTDLWSPALFDQFVRPYIETISNAVHRHRKIFIYTMTTGVETLGRQLADAGVDVLYFVDPVQDTISLETARDCVDERLTLAGGMNSTSLLSGSPAEIRELVLRAMKVMGPTGRFILHPVDALFPDTPWKSIETVIDAWRDSR
jgi:hypothetical protein